MSYTYLSFQNALGTNMALAGAPSAISDPFFTEMLPSIIDYAELRMQREIDFLANNTTDSSKSFTANVRLLALPASPYFISVDAVNVITPASTVPNSGTRNPLLPVTTDFLDAVYSSAAGATVPKYFAMLSNQNMVVGPWPDLAYTVEFKGTTRQAPLYTLGSGGSNFLTQQLPDLYMAAAMVFASGYMRNFGAQADDPRMAQSWETQYQTLMKGADVEEARVKMRLTETSSPSPPANAAVAPA